MLIHNGHLSWCPTLREPCLCKMSGYMAAGALAAGVAALEFWGSADSGSLSLLGDAWHVSSDIVVYLVAIFAGMKGLRAPTEEKKIKNMWAIRNANVLIAVALLTLALAAWRMFFPNHIGVDTMLWVALVGLGVNVVMFLILRAFRIEHEHHGHDHLHDTTLIHTAFDIGVSAVVVMTGWLMKAFPWTADLRIDAVASMVICAFLIVSAQKTKREAREAMHHGEHHHHH